MDDTETQKSNKRKLSKTKESKEPETETKIKRKKKSQTSSQEVLLGESSIERDDSEILGEMDKQTRGSRKKRNPNDFNINKPTQEGLGRFSDYEKMDLFNGLIQHGSSDISVLQSLVPNKSTEHVKLLLNNVKRAARHSLLDGKVKAPIDKWLEFLIADPEKNKNILDFSRTLKYIALFEPRVDDPDVCLSDCYKVLSDCMKGESPKHLNPVTSLFLHEELQKFIRVHKRENYEKEHKHLENLKKKPQAYSGKKKAPNVADPRISNPLKIPDSLLEIKK